MLIQYACKLNISLLILSGVPEIKPKGGSMFGADSKSEEMYELDPKKVERAFRKVGMLNYLKESISIDEQNEARRKGFSDFQWKLLEYFKRLLYEELDLYKQEQAVAGVYVRLSGYTFEQKMEIFSQIAESIFAEWAMRLGINHLYAHSLGEDLTDLRRRIIFDGSGKSILERFYSILHLLK